MKCLQGNPKRAWHGLGEEEPRHTEAFIRRKKAKTVECVPTIGQADKSARGMPWHQEPKKDVTSCDKLRGGANNLRSGDFRMGKPTGAIL